MKIKRVAVWLSVSLIASVLSFVVTYYVNSMGTVIGSQSAQETADWDEFSERFPTKSQYTMEEFQERGKEIERIQKKYQDQHYAEAISQLKGYFFFKETAEKSVRYTWIIWFVLPILFALPLISALLVMLIPAVFMLDGIFFPFEVAVFLGAYCAGIGVRKLSSRLRLKWAL